MAYQVMDPANWWVSCWPEEGDDNVCQYQGWLNFTDLYDHHGETVNYEVYMTCQTDKDWNERECTVGVYVYPEGEEIHERFSREDEGHLGWKIINNLSEQKHWATQYYSDYPSYAKSTIFGSLFSKRQ